MKNFKSVFFLLFIIGCGSFSAVFSEAKINQSRLSGFEDLLVQHVMKCIENAERGISSLSQEALAVEGMSSHKVRHLLNNLCAFPEINYLEIGVWQGSTWIASLYNNSSTINAAVAIDNWSEFGGPKEEFLKNCNTFLKSSSYKIIENDCFQLDLSEFTFPINLYFYDGNHTELSQEKAFTYYDPIFDDLLIAVVDDWNFAGVSEGTRRAFSSLNYEILFEVILPSFCINDKDNWWNGLYVSVIRKKIL